MYTGAAMRKRKFAGWLLTVMPVEWALHRNCWIGQKNFARDAGYARTTVWTANHLTAAMSFLASRGYSEIEDHAFPHTSLSLYLYALEL